MGGCSPLNSETNLMIVSVRRFLLYLGLFFALSLTSCSCEKGEVIPRDDLAEIYADLFVVDQWASYQTFGKSLDSLSLYAAVFEQYGYTVSDFRCSVEEYIKDPDRFSKIIKTSMAILEQRKKELEVERSVQRSEEERQEKLKDYYPKQRYNLSGLSNSEVFTIGEDVKVYVDSSAATPWIFDVQKGRDTVYVGPIMQIEKLEKSDESL